MKPSEKLKSYLDRLGVDVTCAVFYSDDNRDKPLFGLHSNHSQQDLDVFLSRLDKMEEDKISQYCVIWDNDDSYYVYTEDYDSFSYTRWYWRRHKIQLPPKYLK